MNTNKIMKEALVFLLSFAGIAYLTSVYHVIPDTIPTHFDITGEPDAWGDKSTLWGLGIFTSLPIYFLLMFLPKLDPKKINMDILGNSIYKLRLLIGSMMSALIILITYSGFHEKVAIDKWLIVILGIFFMLMGHYMIRLRPNYFIGIRTPWTLENEEVWCKTHLLGGRLWFYGYLILTPVTYLLPAGYNFGLFIGYTLLSTAYTFYYSWKIFKELGSEKR